MELIKRVVNREDFISRDEGDYGNINRSHIYINFELNQTIDNIGVYGDYPFIEKIITNITNNLVLKGLRPEYDIKAWHKSGAIIAAKTTSKLNDLKGYKTDNRFKVGFDINKETYQTYDEKTINSVSRIVDVQGDYIKYVVDAKNDGLLGDSKQNTGLLYIDGLSKTDSPLNKLKGEYGDTGVYYKAQGLNKTNSSLSAIAKEEYLLGIISKPEIKNDVFIDRGQNTVLENHLKMSEIETLEHLVNYGNGYFNVSD